MENKVTEYIFHDSEENWGREGGSKEAAETM